MTRLAAALVLGLAASLASAVPAAAQSAVPIHAFRFAGTPDVALARLRTMLARCWHDDYDSRVHGLYREVATIPAAGASGASVRLEWHRVDRDDKAVGLLKRAFDIALVPDGAATRITVLAYGPHNAVGQDVEAWLGGRERCFAGRYPSP